MMKLWCGLPEVQLFQNTSSLYKTALKCHHDTHCMQVIGFHHPKNDEWMQFDSDLPSDLSNVIDRWRIILNNVFKK